jgi:hypothetical protein
MTQDEFLFFLFKYCAPWFSQDKNPILDALLSGAAYLGYKIYALLIISKNQLRIPTSTGDFLDLTAQDFFGYILTRCPSEIDSDFLLDIQKLMFAPRITRKNLMNRLIDLTGRTPIIYQPFFDAGFYNNSFLNNFFAGSNSPFTIWVTAFRPTLPTLNSTAYLNQTAYASAQSYYGGNSQNSVCVTDKKILETINITIAAGIVAIVTILD